MDKVKIGRKKSISIYILSIENTLSVKNVELLQVMFNNTKDEKHFFFFFFFFVNFRILLIEVLSSGIPMTRNLRCDAIFNEFFFIVKRFFLYSFFLFFEYLAANPCSLKQNMENSAFHLL